MKALAITKIGKPVANSIQIIEIDPPKPKPNEAVIKTEASALNHLDLWVGQGLPGLNTSYPFISGSDACGTVESVGENVNKCWVGKRVILNAAVASNENINTTPEIKMIGEHTHGTHQELFTAPITNLVPIETTDPIQASAFGLTFLTAWKMLVSRANLKEKHKLLITGIGGGVALACLEISQHIGCETYVTSRHEWKLEEAKKLGASKTILDTGDDFSLTIRKLTNKEGVDVVADSIGAAVHMSCLKSLSRGGILVLPGCTSGPIAKTDLARIFWNQLSILGSTMGNMAEFNEVVKLLEQKKLRPKIDSVYKWNEGIHAYKHLESGNQFGKIVIDWRNDND